MEKNNRAVWTEGMFLGPHHFQQHDRFILNSLSELSRSQGEYAYGLTRCDIDVGALAQGKFSVSAMSGIFPDGTPFCFTNDGDLPDPLEIDTSVREQILYLSLPLAGQGEKDIAEEKSNQSFARYLLSELTVRDRHTPDSDSSETVFIAGLWARFMLEEQDQSAYHSIPIARIVERREDGNLILDPDFYCTALTLGGSSPLLEKCKEIYGLLQQRASELAARMGSPSASETGQLTQLLLLMQINRYKPLFQHICQTPYGHPETLFKQLIMMAGELQTLTSNGRICPDLQSYLHRDQYTTFNPVFEMLRESLNWIPDTKTESYPVNHIKAGIFTTAVRQLDLFSSARFVLAVKASVTPDELQRNFPRNSTISSKEKLRDLVNAQSRGIELKPLMHVPSSIPAYENFVYFELRQDDQLWREIANSGDIALHVAGNFNDLGMQLWTIQR